MNNIGEFFIEFKTTGITELLDQMKDLNTKLGTLNTSFDQGVSKGDSFFSKFTGWGLKLTALAGGFLSVGKAIKDAFNIGGEIVKLNVAADVAGVRAEEVEALAIALAPLRGGRKDMGDAANFYRQMTETQTEWWRGQYSKQVIDEMARAGVTGLKATSTREQWMSGLARALNFYQGQHTQQAIGARNLFAKAFGLSDEQMLLFAEGEDYVKQQLAYGYNHLTLSGEGNLRRAMEQTRAKMELQERWEQLVIRLIPLTTEILYVVKEVLSALEVFFNSEVWKEISDVMKWIYGAFKLGLTTIFDWFNDQTVEKTQAQNEDNSIAGLVGGRNNDAYWAVQKVLGHTYGYMPYTVNDLIGIKTAMKNAGSLDPQMERAIQNEIARLQSQGHMVLSDPNMRDMLKNITYDPNIDFATELLLAADRNNLNGRGGSVSNSRNTTANFGNIYINGVDNTGAVVKGQLQAAVNSVGDK